MAVMVPRSDSPTINGGTAKVFRFDQHGVGQPRVQGSSADIGTVESDDLFEDGFEE